MYDVTEPSTKQNINKWLDQINKIASGIPVAVLGNKSDKFGDIQQSNAVKIRDCNLQRDYGHNDIKNFLISIKEDTHIEFQSGGFFSKEIITEKDGCLVGL